MMIKPIDAHKQEKITTLFLQNQSTFFIFTKKGSEDFPLPPLVARLLKMSMNNFLNPALVPIFICIDY